AKTISGNCTERSYKYCTDSNATTCASTPTNTSYTYDCKFYGSTKKSCKTKSVIYRYCAASGIGYGNCNFSPQSKTEKYYCPFIDFLQAGDCETKSVSTLTCTNNTAGNTCSKSSSITTGNYSCSTIDDIIVGTCDQYVEKYCNNNSGTCNTSDDAYYCPTVLNTAKTISGSCTARSYKYCRTSNAEYCKNTPTSAYDIYYCKFYGSTSKSCETKSVSTLTCTNNTAGNICSKSNDCIGCYSCVTVDNIIIGCN
ncbi:MAG: hypothetical protein IJT15_01140, partial [Rickettsiales bacterium]|nr:hypothetical protein [Rickettsiales bacterium]